jgi:diguanylate cyclase (GGDEF)-like protein
VITASFYAIVFYLAYHGLGTWQDGTWNLHSYIRFISASVFLTLVIYLFERSLESAFNILQQTREQEQSYIDQLHEFSITDPLTSLYNRRHFDNIFAEKLVSKRKNLLIFCIIDIDFFKQYNDIYGHQAGDITLKRVAKALNSILERSDDMVFRLGGEEFGMLFSVKEQDDALTIAQNARKKIQNLKIEHSGSKVNDFVTISMGLYVIDKTQTSVTDIYHKADQLLYKAKENGRNQVVSNIS